MSDCLDRYLDPIQYREDQGWTAQLHFDNLRAAFKDGVTPISSYLTIWR